MPPREGHRAARVTPASRNASVPAAGLLAAGVAHARSSPDCMTGVRCTVCMRVTGASTRPANAASTVPTQSQPPTPPPPTALVAASCNAQRSVFGGEAITAALARRAPHVPFWARSKVFDRGLRPDKSGPGLGRRASHHSPRLSARAPLNSTHGAHERSAARANCCARDCALRRAQPRRTRLHRPFVHSTFAAVRHMRHRLPVENRGARWSISSWSRS